jgi:vitamin B12 transporter
MKFHLTVVARASVLMACTGAAHAQSPVPSSSPAQQIVVTANRVPVPLSQVLADVVVIDEAQLRNAAGSPLEDVLRDFAGVQLSRTGPPGQSAGVFIRGSAMTNTVVLIDGVRIGSATLGQAALEALGLGAIERIEVLRGPGSALYGADAVGGVIQIFTRRGQRGAPRVQASLHAGRYGSSEVQGGASAVVGDFDLALSASREASAGVSAVANPADAFGRYNPDADGFSRGSVSAQVGYALTASQRIGLRLLDTRLRSQFDAAEFAPPAFAPDPSPDFRNRLNTQLLAVTHSANARGGLRSELTLSESRDGLKSGANTIDRFDTRRRQLTWQPSIEVAAGTTLVGLIEREEVRVSSSSFGASPVRRSDNTALGISAMGAVDAHRWQVDLRHDDHDVYGAQTTGKLGYAWQVTPQWALRAAVGTAFRAPSFNELYFPDFGVKSLRPERTRNVEVGASWQDKGWRLQATLFDNRVSDLIGYQADPAACPAGYPSGCAANVSRARLRGTSLSAQGAEGAWRWRMGAEFLDAKDRNAGTRLTRRAAYTGSATLGYDAAPWGVQATANAVGARPEGGAQLAAYQLIDLSAHWQLAPRWRLEAKLLNVFDKRYEPAKDYGALGRQAWIGVRFDSNTL